MFSEDRVWVTRIIEWGQTFVDSPFLASVLTLGSIPVVTTGIVFVAVGLEHRSFVVAQTLTASIIVLGPYQAYKYDTSVLPEFFEDVDELVESTDHPKLREIRSKARRLFRVHHVPTVLLWTTAVVSVLPLNSSYFAAQGIVSGTSVYFVYVVFLVEFGLLSGLGLHSVLVTMFTINAISKLSLVIEPLHPDGLGGLSVIGNFAVWTTLLISNGALAIPLSLQMVTTEMGGLVVYTGIGLYVLLIVISFVYPTVKINRTAQGKREHHLERNRLKIRSLEEELTGVVVEDDVDTKEIAQFMEIERARNEFRNYRDVRLYPLSIGIISRLLSSVLLPIVITIFEFYLPQIL